MGKNRRFRNEYAVVISGTTTNGFSAKVMHGILMAVVAGLGQQTAQTQITIKPVSTTGDFDAIKGEYKEGINV